MDYEPNPRKRKSSAIRRVWLLCLLLALPGFAFIAALCLDGRMGGELAVLLAVCILIYSTLVASSLVEGIIRPLQTLSNVLASLREGDTSFRARAAGSQDAISELASEVNALADLLQKQRVRSLESTALVARMFEVMHTPLFAFDHDNTLQLVNNVGLKFLGTSSSRCIGRGARELGLAGLLDAQDHTIHAFEGSPTRWLLRKAAFRQEGMPHSLLLLADVSVPLREEEQAAWKRLIRVLGHELSNSLAPIKSIAGSLLGRVDSLPNELQRDFRRGLSVVESRADALHRFVQSYRQLAQMPPPKFRTVSLGPLIERVVLLEQRIPVEFELGPPVAITADPDQLEQMMINVLANAADASLANGSRPVNVTWSVDAAEATIVIEDRGMGIANPENLFIPFYTTKPAGSGIGLPLAQQIARAHGGEISLENREDIAGARATIHLPLELSGNSVNGKAFAGNTAPSDSHF